MRLFLDTNVLLDYLLDSRGTFHEPAVDLFRLIASEQIEAGFSTSQATDIYYSLRKVAGDEKARQALRGLYALCEVVPTSEKACIDALDLPIGDYEDAVQIETARHGRFDCIITRNLRDFEDSSVPYLDPIGFLALFQARPQDE